jgi:hypothetical protein
MDNEVQNPVREDGGGNDKRRGVATTPGAMAIFPGCECIAVFSPGLRWTSSTRTLLFSSRTL